MKTNVHHDKRCGGGYLGPKWISYLCLCELVSANGNQCNPSDTCIFLVGKYYVIWL